MGVAGAFEAEASAVEASVGGALDADHSADVGLTAVAITTIVDGAIGAIDVDATGAVPLLLGSAMDTAVAIPNAGFITAHGIAVYIGGGIVTKISGFKVPVCKALEVTQ